MKWNEAAILLLQPADPVICECAYAWRRRYAIPAGRCFSHRFPRGHRLAGQLPPGFTELGPDSLSFSDLGTKVIVVSHGNPYSVGNGNSQQDARAFAAQLAVWGLKEVGLLSFRNCLVGKRRFLDDLVEHLSNWRVGVGWLIGYKDAAYSVGIDPGWLTRRPMAVKEHEGCHHPASGKRRVRPMTQPREASGFFDRLLREATNGAYKRPDEKRVKIVRGNRFVFPPGGPTRRYHALETTV